MKKISGRSQLIPGMIRDLEPFDTYGSFHARVFGDHGMNIWQSGILSGYDLEVFKKHQNYIRYAVYSYATPIAWWSPAYGWHKVRQTFSVTTSHHQGRLYLCDGPGSTYRWEPFFDASLRDDLSCNRARGEHSPIVGYTDKGTVCLRHYMMRPAVKQMVTDKGTTGIVGNVMLQDASESRIETQPAKCGCWLNDRGEGHWDACIEKPVSTDV